MWFHWVSLNSPGLPDTQKDLPGSALCALRLKVCTTITGLQSIFSGSFDNWKEAAFIDTHRYILIMTFYMPVHTVTKQILKKVLLYCVWNTLISSILFFLLEVIIIFPILTNHDLLTWFHNLLKWIGNFEFQEAAKPMVMEGSGWSEGLYFFFLLLTHRAKPNPNILSTKQNQATILTLIVNIGHVIILIYSYLECEFDFIREK